MKAKIPGAWSASSLTANFLKQTDNTTSPAIRPQHHHAKPSAMPSKRRRISESSSASEDITLPSSPPTINPYTILALPKTATPDEIKSSYRRLALQHHPDKAPADGKDAAHTKFQEIAFAYAILSDPRRRSRYDTTGRTEESLVENDEDGEEFNWTDFFRQQYESVVSGETIEKFKAEYQGGEEERGDVLKAYVKHRGRMEGVFEEVMLSDVLEDEERFRGIIEGAIREGEVEGFEKFTMETEKKREARMKKARKEKEREADEAEEAEREMQEEEEGSGMKRKKPTKKSAKDDGLGDLAALIQQRQKGRAENFFDDLEAKYAPKGKKSGTKRAEPMDEPPEEAFSKSRAKKAKA